MNQLVLRGEKNLQAKFGSKIILQCQQTPIKLGMTDRISIWRLTKNATKTTYHCFFSETKWF